MAIPSRVEAAALLRDLQPSDKLFNHCSIVGEVAAFLAAAMTRRGVAVNVRLVEAAALLHDIDKALPAGDPYRALGHGAGGAAWLRDHGQSELADAVAAHPVFVLGAAASYDLWAATTTIETRVVAYSDKRAIQEVVSLDARFERWYGRYPNSEMLRAAHERARELERDVCAAAGLAPDDVGRLAWVEAATRDGAAA